MKIKCPYCKKEIEKTNEYVQRCPLCGFFFDPGKNSRSPWHEIIEEGKEVIESKHMNEVSRKILGLTSRSTFAFTGKLNSMTRKQAQELLERKGHTFRSGVSHTLDYLVAGTQRYSSDSAKYRAAKAHYITIINEKDFLELMK